MVCSEPDDGVSGERTVHVNLVAANSAINWSEMFYLYIGLCKFHFIEKDLKVCKISSSSDDPTRKVEFTVKDIEDNRLKDAEITVKKGDEVLADKQKTDADGKFKLTKNVNLGNLFSKKCHGKLKLKHFL